MPLALLPMMDAAPHATARMKKKREKATPIAATVAATDNALTATSMTSTASATKKGKTDKKKSTKPIILQTLPMWVSTIDLTKHCNVAIAHEQKWVVGNTGMITGNVANEPLSDLQWYQKELSGKSERIVTGNPDFVDMLPLDAFIHMMPPEQLDLFWS